MPAKSIAKVLYQEGAWCGVCEYEGWDACKDCRDTCEGYATALSAAGFGPAQEERDALAKAVDLVRDMIDPDDCHFDHHGGCQAHGYLSLQIGELCPQPEAKVWLYNREDT